MKIEYERIFTYNGESVAIVEMDEEALIDYIKYLECEAYDEIALDEYDSSFELLKARAQLKQALEDIRSEADKEGD